MFRFNEELSTEGEVERFLKFIDDTANKKGCYFKEHYMNELINADDITVHDHIAN